MRHLMLSVPFVCGVALTQPSAATACTCISGVSSFETEAKVAPLLIAGEVVRTVTQDAPSLAFNELTVAAIDLQIHEVIRGKETRRGIRVWDQHTASSCSLELKDLKIGAIVILAINPAEERIEGGDLLGVRPAPTDYVWGTCRQPYRTFRHWADVKTYIQELRLNGKEVAPDPS